jgi:hypothetical protein
LYLTQFLFGKLVIYGRISKSLAFAAFVRKAADEKRITIFFIFFAVKKIAYLVVTGNR